MLLVQYAPMGELCTEKPISGLDVVSYDGGNYMRAIECGAWCVSFLNHGDRFVAPSYIERHNGSDEVFVLLCGEAALFIGESRSEVRMECGKIYNVRKNTWHQIVTTPGTHCLVIENADVGSVNSERIPVSFATKECTCEK